MSASYSRNDVRQAVLRLFGESLSKEVLAVLDRYGGHADSGVRARVHLAALKLSGGDLDELKTRVNQAIADSHDVISMAEYPSHVSMQSQSCSEATLRELHESDLRDHQEWLKWMGLDPIRDESR